ncbi:hypothetical protein ACQR1Y_18820 [Bradyrhizobium sp. HKCCYLRH3099]|uniref:hypothetical protein n=1 Tax=unclassified Bradyrhizobium TaxID=2631580 RepID=UPI003EB80EEF
MIDEATPYLSSCRPSHEPQQYRMKTVIEAERLQLLEHWTTVLERNPDWIANRFTQVERLLAASRGAPATLRALSSCIRQVHDKLGFKAKDSLARGGLCAGAIFRTQAFIDTHTRVGSKLGKTIHIEHTFPVRQLVLEIVKRPFPDYQAMIIWLLTHSVATAFHQSETVHLFGQLSTSDALNSKSAKYLKPFSRYQPLYAAGGKVWNVFDGTIVDINQFTFQDHLDVFRRLLSESGAAPSLVTALQSSR